VLQAVLENSNVQPITETTDMIAASRDFQFMANFMQAESDREQAAIDRILPRS
jgi:flagellar basal body rod protein FlgG